MFFAVLAAGVLSAGCVAHAGGHVRSHAHADVVAEPAVVFYEPPTLVAIDAGVWVVPQFHTAVYYVNDAYWYFEGGVWYRASYWDGDFAAVHVSAVPSVIVHRSHSSYVHYVARAGAEVRRAPAHGTMRRSDPPGHRARRGRGPYPGYATPNEPPGHSRKKRKGNKD
jgi:hypothetical protein